MRVPILLAVAAACLVTACDPAPDTPMAPTFSLQSYDASGFAVYPFQLRPDEKSASTAWGEVLVRVGTHHPPDPCTDDDVIVDGSLGLAFCGVVHNPDAETVLGATFRLTTTTPDGDVTVPFRVSFDAPPSPCTTALFRGSIDLAGLPNPGPPGVDAALTTSAGQLVGLPDPGPPNLPNPGPPNAPGSCELSTTSGPVDG